METARDILADSDATFERTTTTLEAGQAQPGALEALRADLAELRDAAASVIDTGSLRARAIQAQIDSLGPPPEEDETEADDIAARRAQLSADLASATEPIRAAREVLLEADLLIDEVDSALRHLDTEQLLERYPTPVFPGRWVTAIGELKDYSARIATEASAELSAPTGKARLKRNLPTILALGLAGIFTLLVLQPMVPLVCDRAAARSSGRARRWFFIVLANCARLLLPALAAVALVAAVRVADVVPFALRTTMSALPAFAAILVAAHWLGHTLFVPANADIRLLHISDRGALRGLRLCQGLGIALVLLALQEAFHRDQGFSDATVAVLSMPPILLTAALLWWLARLLRAGGDDAGSTREHESHELNTGFLKFISVLMQIAAIAATILVLLGFVKLAHQAIVPTILTLALLGIALFLYRLTLIVLRVLLGTGASAGEEALSMLPVIVVFVLGLALTPLLALTWGARLTDIAEVWRALSNGVALGDVRLSLDGVITLLLVFGLGVIGTQWLQRVLRLTVLPRTRLEPGARSAMVTGVGYVGLILTALIAVSAAGLNLSSLAVVFGALSVGIGFGLQNIVSNFVSGIILLIERPIKEGDWIEVSGYSGVVQKIAVRATRIQTFDKHDVIVPNSDLMSGTVTNMTLSSMSGRLILPVGVAYGSDLDTTREILLSAAQDSDGVVDYPEPTVLFMGLGDSSLDFELRCFLKDINSILSVRSELLFRVYKQLDEAGIEIPFPQRDIHLRGLDRLVDAISGGRHGSGSAET